MRYTRENMNILRLLDIIGYNYVEDFNMYVEINRIKTTQELSNQVLIDYVDYKWRNEYGANNA